MRLLHITTRKAWIEATRAGQYVAPSLATEGFIHCSTARQALPVARKFYKGQRELVWLEVDPARLTSVLKWEPPSDGVPPPGVRQGEAFPHVYGPINLEAVLQVVDFETDASGDFSLPTSLKNDHPEELA
jgi:uncharacterized protein (DUF952 family)